MTAIEPETFSHVDSEKVENCWLKKQAAILSTSYLSLTKGHRLHWHTSFHLPFFPSSALSFSQILFKILSPQGISLSSFSFSSPQTLKDNKRQRNGYLNLKQGDDDQKKNVSHSEPAEEPCR